MSRAWPRRRPVLYRALVALVVGYVVVGVVSLGVDLERLAQGVPRGLAFAASVLRPDFRTHATDIVDGIVESLAVTAVATVLGIALAVPVAVGAARNVASLPVYLACRGIVTGARAFPELIVAIFFVVMVGFGPLAGVLTLSLASVGFLAKLLAEAIEGIDADTVDAVRSTGAGRGRVLLWGVVPQVMPRFVGLALYRLDINFRESAIIGVVGAGGIGATLRTAFDRYEFETAAAILIVIVAIVLAGESLSGRIRARLV